MIDSKEKINRVELTAPNPEWQELFTESAAEIKNILGNNCIDIHHIEVLLYLTCTLNQLWMFFLLSKILNWLMHWIQSLKLWVMFAWVSMVFLVGVFYWKSKAKRTHNIHLFEQGASEIVRHLSFRDFMRSTMTMRRLILF